MKHRIVLVIVLVICFSSMIAGCSGKTGPVSTSTCAKCGRTATTTMTGSVEYLKREGIPLSACKKVYSGLYSADVCDSCIVGIVAEIKPDPTWG